ncbi:low affinity immunoglobulin gamma Fc region receptor II-b-like [Anarhichas minor]|uniref:low affinity immunoglobulin gamma Fc region receptor II-b-like n=1 Tax=Anarhichas minor TaxID=65739 RepID=UPI003F73E551
MPLVWGWSMGYPEVGDSDLGHVLLSFELHHPPLDILSVIVVIHIQKYSVKRTFAVRGWAFTTKPQDAAFRIVPNRLQFFEYESVSFHCEGSDGSTQLRGIRNAVQFISSCHEGTLVLSCTIQRAYEGDGGEYWCETKGGERSNSVNIFVTVGPVILESPVLPVAEGDAVALRCRDKTSSNITAAFYKDGLLIRSSSTGNISILSVSRSDEGLYKCRIPDGGESAESWLTVGALHRETCPSSDHFIHVVLVLRTVLTIVMVALLLLLVGLLHWGKLGVTQK